VFKTVQRLEYDWTLNEIMDRVLSVVAGSRGGPELLDALGKLTDALEQDEEDTVPPTASADVHANVPMLCEQLRAAGGVESLSAMVAAAAGDAGEDSTADAVATSALLLLGNLSSDAVDPGARLTRDLLRRADGAINVARHLWSKDEERVLYAAGALMNFATTEADIGHLVALDALPRLASLVEERSEHDVALTQFCTGCLSNIKVRQEAIRAREALKAQMAAISARADERQAEKKRKELEAINASISEGREKREQKKREAEEEARRAEERLAREINERIRAATAEGNEHEHELPPPARADRPGGRALGGSPPRAAAGAAHEPQEEAARDSHAGRVDASAAAVAESPTAAEVSTEVVAQGAPTPEEANARPRIARADATPPPPPVPVLNPAWGTPAPAIPTVSPEAASAVRGSDGLAKPAGGVAAAMDEEAPLSIEEVLALIRSEDEDDRLDGLAELGAIIDEAYGEDGAALGEVVRAAHGIEMLGWMIVAQNPLVQQQVRASFHAAGNAAPPPSKKPDSLTEPQRGGGLLLAGRVPVQLSEHPCGGCRPT
jgi:hypothetical protein